MELNDTQENKQKNMSTPAAESGLEFRISEQLKREEERLRDLKNALESTIESHEAELSRTRQELERLIGDARKYAEDIVNTVREPLIVLDPDMKIVSANRSFYAAFQTCPEEVERKSIHDLPCCSWDMTDLRSLLESILSEHKSFDDYEISMKTGDTGYRTVLLNARQIYRGDTGQQLILMAMEDITETKLVEERRVHLSALAESSGESIISKELSDAINQINMLIFSTLDFDEVLNRVIEEAAKATGADSAAIYLPEDDFWVARYVYGVPGMQGRRVAEEEIEYSILAAHERKIVVINDISGNDEICSALITEYGAKALLDAPLLKGADVIGDFALYSCTAGKIFSDAHVDFIKKVSASVSLAVKNALLFAEVKKANERASFFANAIESASQPFAAGYPDGRLMNYNKAFIDLTGYDENELRSITWLEITPQEWRDYEKRVLEELHSTGQPQIYQKEYIRKDGTRVPIELNVHLIADKKGSPDYYFAFVTDITERKSAEKALQDSKSFLENIMQSVTNVICVTDLEGKIVQLNRAAYELTGYSTEELIGKHFSLLFDEDTLAQIEEQFINITVLGKAVTNYETQIIRKDGDRRLITSSAVPIKEDGKIIGMVGAAQDISERKRMEEEMKHMAHHDALTNLPNRRLFADIIEVECSQARRHRTRIALLFIDLDRFKEVNDIFGHEAGDLLLKEVAVRIRATVRESDTVSRAGGDEFNIILADIVKVEDISDIARKIVESFRQPFSVAGHELHITTSIGISVYPDDSVNIDSLFRYADIAMYHAKEQGRNTFQFYNHEINIRSIKKMRLEGMLRQTIARGELVVYYQPQVNVQTRQVVCAEALVRWSHPKLGLLEPKQFILMAEDTGFITAIDEWVLRTACGQVRVWLDDGLSIRVTANLSAREFHNPELTKRITQILSDTGVPPDCLDIEITESLAMSNIERTISHLRELADMGVHISIDDFGTGYSSLNYLKRLPIQKLKIDKSFIRDIAVDPDDRSIITAVTSMAHNMAITVLAEGVETEDQFSFLHETHCDEAQGYLFSRPLPAEEFREFMAANR